jgi:hypothetical protein
MNPMRIASSLSKVADDLIGSISYLVNTVALNLAVLMRRSITPEKLFEKIDAVWGQARGARALPRRVDIDPAKLAASLPHVTLLDVVPGEPVDFRYRLIGQQLITAFGDNVTGATHRQQANPARKDWPMYEAYVRCLKTRQPQDIAVEFRNRNQALLNARARVWPLSDDGETVTGLLGGCVFVAPTLG